MIRILKTSAFEVKTGALREAENEVHILDRLTGSAFHEIVDYADHVELTAVFTYIEHTLFVFTTIFRSGFVSITCTKGSSL